MKTFFPLIFAILAASVQNLFGSTNLTPASTAVVSVNATTLVFRAAGLLESNAIARVNQPALIADITFETNAWYETGTNAWTNAAGWSCAGTMTNGVLDCDTNPIISPWIIGPGLRSVDVVWSNMYLYDTEIAWTTNDTDWVAFEDSVADLHLTWPAYRVRIKAGGESFPPDAVPSAILSRIIVTGHRHPALIGSTNDYAGIVIRVDNPVGPRDAVNLQTLNSAIAGVNSAAQSPSNWSSYVAATPVNYAGQALILDPRYTLSITNDTLSLTFGGQPIYEIIGGGTVTPMIVSFAMEGGTNITIRVTGAVGWRPYPEWCGDLLIGSWTRLATNEFASTYPALANGQYDLTFAAVTNTPAFYRVSAEDETGGSNTLSMAIRIPLQIDGAVTGQGMALYATTQSLAAAVAPLASTQALQAAVAPLASTQALTQALATAVAPLATTQALQVAVAPLASTQALQAAVAPLASTETDNTYAIWTTQRCDAIEILNSSVSTNITYVTNLLVSGSGSPSPNGLYKTFDGIDGWALTNVNNMGTVKWESGVGMYYVWWYNLPDYSRWTNSTLAGTYEPYVFEGTYTNSGSVIVDLQITTNTIITTNRTVALRLLPGGIESQGTNASWRELSLLADISTNDSGAVTGRTYQTIRYLGAP